jgi:cytochrome bd-type quinol oxidase subunit 2
MGHLEKDQMKKGAIIFIVLGLLFGIFGYWGMFTKAGTHAYEEMDGMYPFFALLAGILLICIALILFIVTIIRKKKN